jgi:hypothetical protein
VLLITGIGYCAISVQAVPCGTALDPAAALCSPIETRRGAPPVLVSRTLCARPAPPRVVSAETAVVPSESRPARRDQSWRVTASGATVTVPVEDAYRSADAVSRVFRAAPAKVQNRPSAVLGVEPSTVRA